MAKIRSPVLGFNHNIRHNGWLFHVQTEDSGVQSPHIFTHLFHEGIIVASKKLEYDPESDGEVVKTLMQAQHKSVMKELKHGVFDEKIKLYLGAKPDVVALDGVSAPFPIVDSPSGATIPDDALAHAAPEPIPIAVSGRTDVSPRPPTSSITAEAGATIPVAAEPSSSPYSQLLVSAEQQQAAVSGVLDARDADEDDEINGLLSRLKEESPDTAGESEKPGTWLVSRPGKTERPFDKTGPVAVPIPIQREENARRHVNPHLPEVQSPPPTAGRSRKMTLPSIPGSGTTAPRRPTPPPTQVNPVGPAPTGQHSTVRPAPPTRPSSQVPAARPPSGTNPPVGPHAVPRPPTIPPARLPTPPPIAPSGAFPPVKPPTIPPRAPVSQIPPTVAKPPPIPPLGRSQAVPPVPPAGSVGARGSTGANPPRPPIQVNPQRSQPVTTSPMRAQTVVAPTGIPPRPSATPRPAPGGARSQPVSVPPIPGRRGAPSEGVVVARPAVVIGAPPTVIGGPVGEGTGSRRMHGREPTPPPLQPESIFGQDLISEKSLDEVIMAYLSEDSNED